MKKTLWVLLVVLEVLLVTVGAPGCLAARKPAPAPAPAAVVGPSPALFFPIQPGLKWEYQGTGNEYATFTNELIRAQGDLAQMRSISGTTTGSLFSVTNDTVTRLVRKELAQDRNLLTATPEEKVILLKAPLAPGTSWANGSETRSIVSVGNVIQVPAGVFQDVVKVQINTPGQTAQTFEYYARGVGLVKAEYVSGNNRVVSELKLFSKGQVAMAPPVQIQVPAGEAKVPPVKEVIEGASIVAQTPDSIRVGLRILRTYEPTTPGSRNVQTSDTVVIELMKQNGVWVVKSSAATD